MNDYWMFVGFVVYVFFICVLIADGYYSAKVKIVPPIMNDFITRQFGYCKQAHHDAILHNNYLHVASKYCDQLSNTLWGVDVDFNKKV